MAEITRDPILGREVHLDQDETLIAVFRADPAGYWRSHVIMALVAGVIAGAALVYGGNTAPWVGPLAAVLAIGLRARSLGRGLEADKPAADWAERTYCASVVPQAGASFFGRGAARDTRRRQASYQVSGKSCGDRRGD